MSNGWILCAAGFAAIAAGWCGLRLGIPVGGMLGSMLAAAVVSLTTGGFSLGDTGVLVLQLYVGFSSGCGIGRKQVKTCGRALPILLVLLPLYCLFNVAFGVLMSRHSGIDLITAMFSLVPGGATDMGTISAEMGADNSVVGILQVVRVLFCSLVYPQAFHLVMRVRGRSGARQQPLTSPGQPFHGGRCLIAAAASTVGGLGLKVLGIPGGAILGSMLAAMAVSCLLDGILVPRWSKDCLQLASGLYLGSLVTAGVAASMASLLTPVLIQMVNMILFETVAVLLVRKLCKISLETALPVCATGGLTEMLPITYGLGGDALVVSTVHALRIIVVVAAFPHLAKIVASLL